MMTYCFLGGVHINEGPTDIQVHNGQTARFPCHNEGTQSFPYWKIGGTLYTALNLPSQHNYDLFKQELVVRYTRNTIWYSVYRNTNNLYLWITWPSCSMVRKAIGSEH